jgi:coenzyme F420-reducing hydrogenase delta subunit/ferredoxin
MTGLFEPKIVGFLCNWCSYAGADLAGTSRLSYPPNIRIVRVPCSGRVDPLFVARALKEGADGVLVLGCHPGDCHYSDGNYVARRRFAVMQELLFFLGFERERVKLDWVSASEGARFARVVSEFTEQVRQLGPRGQSGVSWANAGPADFQPAVSERRPPVADLPADAAANQALRELASRLLAEKQVQVVLGWEQGSVRRRPLFARTAEQAQRLLVNRAEPLNLVNYLRNLRGQRTAVLVRPQDARTLNILVSEGQLNRDDLFLIGFATQPPGRYDATLAFSQKIAEPLPPPPRGESTDSPALALAEVEAWPTSRRAAFWQAQFSQCQRCYACRQACPLCYCSECVAEQLDPAWQSIAIETNEKTFFHVLRAFHLAGRCGDCQACSQACPVGVPLYLLNQKVAQEVARLFDGYVAGADPSVSLPLTTFRRDEVLTQSGVCAANRRGLQEARRS